MKINIWQVFLAVGSAIAGIKPTTSLANDIQDVQAAIGVVQTLDPNVDLTAAKAGAQNLATIEQKVAGGSYALAASVGAEFDGVADKVVFIGFRQYENGGAPADSDAAKLKDMLGL